MSSGASQMSGVTDPTNNNNSTNPSVSSGWRGGRGYQGYKGDRPGRGRDSQGRGHGRTTTYNSLTSVPKNKFRGNTPGMNGHVFQCFSEGGEAKQFTKTINVLGEYIGKTYTHPADLASLTNLTPVLTPVVKPPEPNDKLSVLDKEIWTITVKKFCNRTEAQENNLVAIYKVIWGQCSEDMQSRLKGLDTFTTNDTASDCVWLLTNIRSIIHRFDEQNSFYLSSILALNQYVTCKQGEHESDLSYYERFLAAVDLYELYHGRIGQSPEALKAASDKSKMKESERSDLARERTLAMQFFYNADRVRYGIMWTNAKNEITAGFDKYPTSLRAAYNMIVNYEAPTPIYPTRRNNYVAPTPAPTPAPASAPAIVPTTTSTPTSERSFVQTGEMIPGTDGITHNGVHCFKCDRYGHYANLCSGTPAPKPAVQLFQHCSADPASHFTFAQPTAPSGIIPSNWVLLDSQSTVSVFCNANYLSNIRRSPQPLLVYTNGGTQESSMIGDVPLFGPVWYNPNSLANILSLAAVRKLCRVTMDTTTESALCVHRTDGSIMRFLESPSGLYYHDPAMPSPAYSFVSTVDENKSRFTPRELDQANNALVLHRRLGRPAQARFERLLREGFIRNCPNARLPSTAPALPTSKALPPNTTPPMFPP